MIEQIVKSSKVLLNSVKDASLVILKADYEQKLSPVVYVPGEGLEDVTIGDVTVYNPTHVWIAHDSPLSISSDRDSRYKSQQHDGFTAILPYEGTITITGRVETPERTVFEGVESDIQNRVYDPYRVMVGTADGVQEFANAPSVELNYEK